MSPTLEDGDFVCALKWPRHWLKLGHVVVADSEKYGVVVKRISSVSEDGSFTLVGDNSVYSVSQAAMGDFSASQLLGKVIYHAKASR
ncbi:hypothetical protein D210916BOD24_02480 [Alteromonas sp. D210916BOD_24]